MEASSKYKDDEFPDPHIAQPTQTHKQTLVLLHGLGSNGKEFGSEFLATAITSSNHTIPSLFPNTKFTFPTAKLRRSSAFSRSMLRQWFDITSLEDPSFRSQTQIDGLVESAQFLMRLLEEEIKIVGASNVILGGLSMGCAMSVSLLLALRFPIGGYIGLSGWLPFQKDVREILDTKEDEEIFAEDGENNLVLNVVAFERELLGVNDGELDRVETSLSTPVFMGHGEKDEKVKYELGESMAKTMESMGMDIVWKSYPDLGHSYKMSMEIDHIVTFIQEKVGWEI